jgi:hypothetical protein
MTKVRIHPEYGYGWYHADMTVFEVPADFDLSTDEAVQDIGELRGRVESVSHELFGMIVFLSRRTLGANSTYNLLAFKEGDANPRITGFCSLKPLEDLT